MPTGATVAALTTSLPETPGGERNWDYRYTWMRDTTFTLQALHWLNLDWEADEFMQFVADLEPNSDGALQIMYGIDGRRDLTESTLDHLSGYAGARPVRIGNGAFDQRQNDVFGAVLDSILLHTRRSERLPRRLWPIVESQAECATQVWREPDQGIWEAAGRRSTTSRPSSCAGSRSTARPSSPRSAATRKGSGLAGDRGRDPRRHPRARRHRPRRASPALRDGRARRVDAARGDLRVPARRRRAPPRDRRGDRDELTENGFVLRYRTDETDDGLSGKEGTFLICSFWLVSALAIVGELQQARDLMERLLRIASPLGLYAEEFDADTGRHLGNFPQAFSHLALIEAAARIIARRAAASRCRRRARKTTATDAERPRSQHRSPHGSTPAWSVPHPHGGRARRGMVLDGLQITIASSVTGVLTSPQTLEMSSTEVGLIASVYLVGEMVGALVFGRMSDQLGRKRLLIIPCCCTSSAPGSRRLTGERQRLAVARVLLRDAFHGGHGNRRAVRRDQLRDRRDDALEVRGRVDIWINGSYWAGAILGSFARWCS